MERCCCPEMSRDTNGSTGTIDIRWFLTQLDLILCHSVLKLNDWRGFFGHVKNAPSFVEGVFFFEGRGDEKWRINPIRKKVRRVTVFLH